MLKKSRTITEVKQRWACQVSGCRRTTFNIVTAAAIFISPNISLWIQPASKPASQSTRSTCHSQLWNWIYNLFRAKHSRLEREARSVWSNCNFCLRGVLFKSILWSLPVRRLVVSSWKCHLKSHFLPNQRLPFLKDFGRFFLFEIYPFI